MKFLTYLALLSFSMLSIFASAEEASTILTCDGILSYGDRNAPDKLKSLTSPTNVSTTYTISKDKITSKDLMVPGDSLNLCESTSVEYIFSTNCKSNPDEYALDWMRSEDMEAALKLMFKKYGEYGLEFVTVRIDRVRLTFTHDNYSVHGANDLIKSKSKPSTTHLVYHPFLTTEHIESKCEISKTKI